MAEIRLLAFDIDGTLSPAGEPVAPAVLEALRACVTAGIVLVPATGRKFSSIARLCQQIGIRGPVITCNGAIVVDAGSGRVLSSHFLGKNLYRRVLGAIGEDPRFSLAVFTGTDIVCAGEHFAARTLGAIGEPVSRFVDSLEVLAQEDVAKVLGATAEEATLLAAQEEYRARFDGACSITATSRQFLEFMPPGVSKGAALAEIAAARGIERDQVACIGDSDNDLSMFEVAGLGLAVANATQKVLAAATAIVPPAEEAGVAHAVREFVLRQCR